MIADDWTPHRRDAGELAGWIRPQGAGWVAVDMLEGGATGDGAEPWRVRLVEVTPGSSSEPGRVVVQTDDFGAVDVPVTRVDLPWPAPPTLRLRRNGESGVSPFG